MLNKDAVENDNKIETLETIENKARRDLLLNVGRLSAYAVPASLAMLTTSYAGIGSGAG